jgi:hypothetical protein
LEAIKAHCSSSQEFLWMINQAKLCSFCTDPRYMYGYEIPRNYDHDRSSHLFLIGGIHNVLLTWHKEGGQWQTISYILWHQSSWLFHRQQQWMSTAMCAQSIFCVGAGWQHHELVMVSSVMNTSNSLEKLQKKLEGTLKELWKKLQSILQSSSE